MHYFEEDSIEGTLYNEDGTKHKKQPSVATKAPTVKYTLSKPQVFKCVTIVSTKRKLSERHDFKAVGLGSFFVVKEQFRLWKKSRIKQLGFCGFHSKLD